MIVYKGIWKTGVIAAALTLIGGLIVMRMDVVHLGAAAGSDVHTYTVTRVIPQIAAGLLPGSGNRYRTSIQIVNTGSAAVFVQGTFHTTADGSASPLNFTTNMAGVAISGGALPATNLPANSTLAIESDPAAAFQTNWAKIQATGAISIVTLIEIRDAASNVTLSRVGIPASPANMTKFLIPRVRDVAGNIDVGFAIVNTGSVPAALTATLRDAAGAVVGEPRTITLAAGAQSAQFAHELFGLDNEPAGRNYSSIIFESTSAQFAAVGLAFEGSIQTSFPAEQLR